jgi:hypothetical protein
MIGQIITAEGGFRRTDHWPSRRCDNRQNPLFTRDSHARYSSATGASSLRGYVRIVTNPTKEGRT